MAFVAEAAGCTKPTLYRHFGGKDALFRAALEREVAALERHLFDAYQAGAGLPLGDQIRNATTALFDYATAQPAGFRLLFDERQADPHTEIRARLLQAVRDRIAGVVRAYADQTGRPLGASADVLAAMMVALVIDGARQALLVSHVDPAAAARLACGLLDAAVRGVDPGLLAALDRAAGASPPPVGR